MSTTWILIANASQAHIYEMHRARLFKSNGHAEENLQLLETFEHAASRKKTGELVTDRVGNNRSSGHGAFAESTNPKAHEAEVFAKELMARLDVGRVAGKFDDVVLVASPGFHGLLQKHLSNPLSKQISRTLTKDYTSLSGRHLAEQLREQL